MTNEEVKLCIRTAFASAGTPRLIWVRCLRARKGGGLLMSLFSGRTWWLSCPTLPRWAARPRSGICRTRFSRTLK